MLAVCPRDPEHKTFVTSVTVQEYWFVTETGSFIDVSVRGKETVDGPHPKNLWTCEVCNAEAKVTR